MNPSRLPHIVEDMGHFYSITNYHPKTGSPWDVRLVQKTPFDEETWDLLDKLSRTISKQMQHPHEH